VSSTHIEGLKPWINKTFSEMQARIAEIERSRGSRDAIIEAICKYVSQTVTAESRLLLMTLCSRMSDETLASGDFPTARERNKFHRKGIGDLIYDKYNFTTTEVINYAEAKANYIALSVSVGSVGIGVVLWKVLHYSWIIPIALVVAGGLYYFLSEQEKSKRQVKFSEAIHSYLDQVKQGLISWLEGVEVFYNEQVEDLKKSMAGGSDE